MCSDLWPAVQVLCIGPTGTGKTLTISNKLLRNLPLEYISHFLTFSARTSANQTQDLIDSKLDKRQVALRPPWAPWPRPASAPHQVRLLGLPETSWGPLQAALEPSLTRNSD